MGKSVPGFHTTPPPSSHMRAPYGTVMAEMARRPRVPEPEPVVTEKRACQCRGGGVVLCQVAEFLFAGALVAYTEATRTFDFALYHLRRRRYLIHVRGALQAEEIEEEARRVG